MENNHSAGKSSFNVVLMIIAVLLLTAVVVFVYLNLIDNSDENLTAIANNENSVVSESPNRENVLPEKPKTPDIPVKPESEQTVAESQESEANSETPIETLKPLPTLDQADPFVRNYFQELGFNDQQILWLSSSELFQRWVTVIDGLSQGQLIRGVVSVEPPKTSFPVSKIDNRYYLDEKGFSRFNNYISGLEVISPKALAAAFHYFRPLLEKTYGQLGYPPENFDNTLILALDNILNAPVYPGPIELKSKSVVYIFEDPELEKLTPLEKFMVRMGPENTARIQKYVATFKNNLLSSR